MFSFRYALRETGQNLWRNILLAVATMITVGVSLAMFGGFMLFQVAVDNATARWQDGVEFIVWMNADVGTPEDSSVRNQLDESPGVETWQYIDSEQSYEEFKEFFEDTPEVLEIFTAEGVPPYYRVVPTDPDSDVVEELGSQFKGKPGVRTVTFAGDVIRDVQNLSDRAGRVLFIGSIVLLGASTLLILNTLAVAIGNRRTEIEIMRLVGATKWFIRIPFMLEGLVQGPARSGRGHDQQRAAAQLCDRPVQRRRRPATAGRVQGGRLRHAAGRPACSRGRGGGRGGRVDLGRRHAPQRVAAPGRDGAIEDRVRLPGRVGASLAGMSGRRVRRRVLVLPVFVSQTFETAALITPLEAAPNP